MPSLNTKLASAPNTTSGYVLRATSSTTIGNSTIQDDGTNVAIGTTPGTYKLNVSGTFNATGAATFSSSVTAGVLNTSNAFSDTINISQTSGSTIKGHLGVFADSLYISNNYFYNGAQSYDDTSKANSSIEMGTGFIYLKTGAANTVPSTRMTITSGGNVGIGTSSPESLANNTTLQIDGTSHSFVRTGTSTYGGYFATIPTADVMVLSNVRNPVTGTFSNVNKSCSQISLWGESANGYITFSTSATNNAGATERMRITSGGELYWNLTGVSGGSLNGGGVLFRNNSGKYVQISTGVTIDTGLIYFYKSDGAGSVTNTGAITTSGNSTVYGTTSDYRIKEDLKEFNGLEKLLNIKVYDFKFKGTEFRTDGVIAHQLQEVLPYAVTGCKDDIDADGNPKIQNVDYSKIVPVLVKAVQELNQKGQEQQAQIEELKQIVATK